MHNVWAIGRMLLLWCHSPVWKIPSSGDQLHARDALPAYDKACQHRHAFRVRHAIASRKTDQSNVGILTFWDGYLLRQEQTPDRMTINTRGLKFGLLNEYLPIT